MSMMVGFNYLLGFNVKQGKKDTFLNQSKHMRELIKWFELKCCKSINTLMSPSTLLNKDLSTNPLTIRNLMVWLVFFPYMITSRFDIIYNICLYANFQLDSK